MINPLDKDTSKATLQQKMLLWNKKPVEFPLSDIDDIAVKSDVVLLARSSGLTQRLPALWLMSAVEGKPEVAGARSK